MILLLLAADRQVEQFSMNCDKTSIFSFFANFQVEMCLCFVFRRCGRIKTFGN